MIWLAAAYAAYLVLLVVLYGRRRRWIALAGWALLMGGLLLAFGGAGDWFAWAGLFWSFVAGAGLLLITSDVVETVMRRRNTPLAQRDARHEQP